LRHATGMSLRAAFRIRPPNAHTKPKTPAVKAGVLVWRF